MSTSNKSKQNTTKTANTTNLVEKLADILNDKNLTDIDYETEDIRIHIARNIASVGVNQSLEALVKQPQAAPQPDSNEPSVPEIKDDSLNVKAPMVGVAYLSAEPGATPFIKTNDKVKKGQTLLLIEAMKTFNPVRSPIDGTVSSILITDGQPIEFDQPLIILK